MATDALAAFLARDFPRADAELAALSSSTAPDPRVRHNRLVAQIYASTAESAVDDLLTFLASHLPAPSPTSPDAFLRAVAADRALPKPLCAAVGPVALYNAAVVAYARRRVAAAAALGAVLYANIEAMDDWLALKTCFLLIDIYLRLCDVPHAAAAAAYAEKLIPAFAKPADSSSAAPQSEIKVLAPDWAARGKPVLDPPATYEDIKFCMHIYNARLSAVNEGVRNIRKEAKSAVLAADDTDSRPTAAALLVKARVEQNLAKSLRILGSIGTQCPPHIMKKIRPLTLNSLGILHHRLGKHCLAACYFEHARRSFEALFADEKETKEPPEESPTPTATLTVLSSFKDTHVSYNLAMQNMMLGDYTRALELFTIAARSDPTLATDSAMLWIRMAECCVGLESSAAQACQSLVVEGQGQGRRFIMRSEEKDNGFGMEYACTCARAAIAILDRSKSGGQMAANGAQKDKIYSPVPGSSGKQGNGDSPDLAAVAQPDSDQLIRGAALCLLAYSCLSFDPQAALEACDELISLYPQVENERGILARLYSAEALCLVGRASEAASRLAPLLAMTVSAESNFKEAACINMALSHVSNNDIPAASRAAKVALKVADQQGHQGHGGLRKQASFVAAYIFLRSGETEGAREVLRNLHASGL